MKTQELYTALRSLLPTLKHKLPCPVLHGILIQSRNGRVQLTATNLQDWKTIEVFDTIEYPGWRHEDFSIVLQNPKLMKELLYRVAKSTQHLSIKSIDNHRIEISGYDGLSQFCYQFQGMSADEFPIQPINLDLPLDDIRVHSVKIDTSNNHIPETIMNAITITHNYFADLNAAVDAGLFTRNGKNPKKVELYSAIEAHNAAFKSAEPEVEAMPLAHASVTAPVEQSSNVYDGLLAQWKEKKSANAQKAKKESTPKRNTFAMVQEISALVEVEGVEAAAAKFEKPEAYVKRANRAYTELYLGSDVIRNLFDANQISWAAIHKLAGHNPSKVGMQFIEEKALAIAKSNDSIAS